MPATAPAPSISHPPAAGLHKAVVSLLPSTGAIPKTPQHQRIAEFIPHPTPTSHGTSILHKMRSCMDQTPRYSTDKYHDYIVQDFESHRVFVDIDVFMKRILRVPDNWKEVWGPTIRKIKYDEPFVEARTEYTSHCGRQGSLESKLYEPLVEMANAINRICTESTDESVVPLIPQRYLKNDPKGIMGGVMNDLSPDIVAVHDSLFKSDGSEDGNGSKLSWAHPLRVLEVKSFGGALVDGSCMPRLVIDGQDPQTNHALYKPPKSGETTVDDGVLSASELAPTLKRSADDPAEASRKAQKQQAQSAPGTREEAEKRMPRTNETKRQKEIYVQVGRYLLEQFSIPGLRSHATVAVVDRNRIQFYYATHSVILVSSAIAFSTFDPEEGVDKFIAIVIAFNRLSLRDNGILNMLPKGPQFINNAEVMTSATDRNMLRIQEGNQLKILGKRSTQDFTVTFGKLISREPSLAGRSTAVLQATATRWSKLDLVVKISWPGSGRVGENEFMEGVKRKAKGEHKWATNHLPRVLYSQDVVFESDSAYANAEGLFDNAKIINGEFKYEQRTLRILIMERLDPLTTLTKARDVAQVLVDIACIHRWLYEHAGILHRDLSPNNIMYRRAGGKVHGVLVDYDLASWRDSLTKDYQKTSEQRTGTPPFMAHGLLHGTDPLHLYRHDLESLFYVMLILVTHYEIKTQGIRGGLRTREGTLEFKKWFEAADYETLAGIKLLFFAKLTKFNVSPSFDDFHDWLGRLQWYFFSGFQAKGQYQFQAGIGRRNPKRASGRTKKKATFDDETLGGHVTYSAFIKSVRQLTGELKGLIIRGLPSTSATVGRNTRSQTGRGGQCGGRRGGSRKRNN